MKIKEILNIVCFGACLSLLTLLTIFALMEVQQKEIDNRNSNCEHMCIAKGMYWNSNFTDMCVCNKSEILYRYNNPDRNTLILITGS